MAIDSYSLYKDRLAPSEWKFLRTSGLHRHHIWPGFTLPQKEQAKANSLGFFFFLLLSLPTHTESSFLLFRTLKKKKKTHTLQHGPVSRIGDGKDVRRHFVSLLALVQINDLLRVDGQPLVGVNYHAKQARVCLQSSLSKEKKNRSFVSYKLYKQLPVRKQKKKTLPI